MRKSLVLRALFPPVRQQVLTALFLQPERSWYLSELAAHLGASPSSLQRELDSLSRSGILERAKDGRRIYFKPDAAAPIFEQLRLLFEKTAGLVPTLQGEINRFGDRVTFAMIYGSVARNEAHSRSDVDLMIVGSVGTAALLPTLRRLERKLDRDVNVKLYSDNEFGNKGRADHFIDSVLKGNLIFLKGSRDELKRAARAA